MISAQPSASTNSRILKGMEIVVGGKIAAVYRYGGVGLPALLPVPFPTGEGVDNHPTQAQPPPPTPKFFPFYELP